MLKINKAISMILKQQQLIDILFVWEWKFHILSGFSGAIGYSHTLNSVALISLGRFPSLGPMSYSLCVIFKFVVQDSRGYTVKRPRFVSCCCVLPPSLSYTQRHRYLDPAFWSKFNLQSFATQLKICLTLDAPEWFVCLFVCCSVNRLIFKEVRV